MFGKKRIKNGAGRTNSADVCWLAAAQVKKALDLTVKLKEKKKREKKKKNILMNRKLN